MTTISVTNQLSFNEYSNTYIVISLITIWAQNHTVTKKQSTQAVHLELRLHEWGSAVQTLSALKWWRVFFKNRRVLTIYHFWSMITFTKCTFKYHTKLTTGSIVCCCTSGYTKYTDIVRSQMMKGFFQESESLDNISLLKHDYLHKMYVQIPYQVDNWIYSLLLYIWVHKVHSMVLKVFLWTLWCVPHAIVNLHHLSFACNG